MTMCPFWPKIAIYDIKITFFSLKICKLKITISGEDSVLTVYPKMTLFNHRITI